MHRQVLLAVEEAPWQKLSLKLIQVADVLVLRVIQLTFH